MSITHQSYCIVLLCPVLRQFCRLRTGWGRNPNSACYWLWDLLHAIQFTTWEPYFQLRADTISVRRLSRDSNIRGRTFRWRRSYRMRYRSVFLEHCAIIVLELFQGTLLREVTAKTRQQGAAVTALCHDEDCNFMVTADRRKYILYSLQFLSILSSITL